MEFFQFGEKANQLENIQNLSETTTDNYILQKNKRTNFVNLKI